MGIGIRQHGPIKTFLTRGIFGGMLRPILYSNTEKISFDFLSVISKTTSKLKRNLSGSKSMILTYWFTLAPLYHFENLFLPSKDGFLVVPLLDNADINNGKECAYLTQGFILYYLQQIIKTSPDFGDKTKLTIKEIDACISILGNENKVKKYLDHYRKVFNSIEVNPLDQPIVYVIDVAKLFIPDYKKQKRVMQKWDDDLIGKFNFINGFGEFIKIQKDNSLLMLN